MAKPMTPAAKRYLRDFGVAMALYTLTVIGGAHAILRFDPPQWGVALIALTPLAPALLGLRAYLVFVDRIDELQRRIQHESLLIAAALVGFGSFAYGFLEAWAHFPHIPLVWLLPAMIATWGAASIFVSRRYR